MKKTASIFCVSLVLFFTACNRPVKGKNGVVYSNAVAYNDYIVNRQTEVMKLIFRVNDEMKTDMNTADQTLTSAVALINKDITEIEGMPEWKGNTSLRENALGLFRFYKVAFGDYYRRIIAIQKDNDITKAEEAELKQLVAKIDESEGPLDTKFQKAQQEFSSQNKMRIEKNELQDKIDDMNKEDK